MRSTPPELPAVYSPELKGLVSQLLQPNPTKRPSASEIEQIPVVQHHLRKWKDTLRAYETPPPPSAAPAGSQPHVTPPFATGSAGGAGHPPLHLHAAVVPVLQGATGGTGTPPSVSCASTAGAVAAGHHHFGVLTGSPAHAQPAFMSPLGQFPPSSLLTVAGSAHQRCASDPDSCSGNTPLPMAVPAGMATSPAPHMMTSSGAGGGTGVVMTSSIGARAFAPRPSPDASSSSSMPVAVSGTRSLHAARPQGLQLLPTGTPAGGSGAASPASRLMMMSAVGAGLGAEGGGLGSSGVAHPTASYMSPAASSSASSSYGAGFSFGTTPGRRDSTSIERSLIAEIQQTVTLAEAAPNAGHGGAYRVLRTEADVEAAVRRLTALDGQLQAATSSTTPGSLGGSAVTASNIILAGTGAFATPRSAGGPLSSSSASSSAGAPP